MNWLFIWCEVEGQWIPLTFILMNTHWNFQPEFDILLWLNCKVVVVFFFKVLLIKLDLRRCCFWRWCRSYLSATRCQAHRERIVQSFSAPSKAVTFLFLSFKWRQVLGAKARRVGWILPQGREGKKKMFVPLEQKKNKLWRPLLWLLKQFPRRCVIIC